MAESRILKSALIIIRNIKLKSQTADGIRVALTEQDKIRNLSRDGQLNNLYQCL